MPNSIMIKAGDTEPLEYTINAAGITNLDDLTSAALYVRQVGQATNHVDGASVTVSSSPDRKLTFDPVGAKVGGGNAFDAAGTYEAYTLVTWSDGDTTRHPGAGYREIRVGANFE